MTRPECIHNGPTRRIYNAAQGRIAAFADLADHERREWLANTYRADREPGIYPSPEEVERRRAAQTERRN